MLEQSRVPSLVRGYAVPRTQSVLRTPPTPGTACCDFVALYASVGGLPTAVTGLPCCTIYPPQHATPATPGVDAATSVISATSSGLPLQTRGSASPVSVTRLRPGSLALRPAALPLGNLRPPITRTPLPGAKKAYGQLLSRDFNPLDIPPITANGLSPIIPSPRSLLTSLRAITVHTHRFGWTLLFIRIASQVTHGVRSS